MLGLPWQQANLLRLLPTGDIHPLHAHPPIPAPYPSLKLTTGPLLCLSLLIWGKQEWARRAMTSRTIQSVEHRTACRKTAPGSILGC